MKYKYTVKNQYGQPIAETSSLAVADAIAVFWSKKNALADVFSNGTIVANYEFGTEAAA